MLVLIVHQIAVFARVLLFAVNAHLIHHRNSTYLSNKLHKPVLQAVQLVPHNLQASVIYAPLHVEPPLLARLDQSRFIIR